MFQDRDLKQYMDQCKNIISADNIRVMYELDLLKLRFKKVAASFWIKKSAEKSACSFRKDVWILPKYWESFKMNYIDKKDFGINKSVNLTIGIKNNEYKILSIKCIKYHFIYTITFMQ